MAPGLPGELFPWLNENMMRSLCTTRGELGLSQGHTGLAERSVLVFL